MRLSTVFELLLIFLLVAFAAYGRVIDRDEAIHQRAVRATNNTKQDDMGLSTMSLKQATDNVNRYCTCNENICNCCRDFHIPLVQLKGPGCASLQYLQGDNLAVQLSFGDNILTSTIVNGKSPKPVCVPLPGGFTKFCGRIYSIQRDAKNHFKACLGLELQSATELEASLRVSCFRFGPDGLKLRPAEPLPVVEAEASDEDDDDDFFGLGSDDDDDDDDEDDERPSINTVSDAGSSDVQSDDDDDDEDDDPLGFSAFLDIFTGGEDSTTKRPKPSTAAPLLEFTIPILTRPTTLTPLEDHDLVTVANNAPIEDNNNDENTQEPVKDDEQDTVSNSENSSEDNQDEATEASNKIQYYAKPDKGTNKVKKGVTNQKKPTVTSTSMNAIDDVEKPVKRPIKDEEDDDDILEDDEDEEEEEEEDEEPVDDDEDDKYDEEDEDESDESEKQGEQDDDDEDVKAEDLDDLDDDDEDEEEGSMLSALMDTGKSKKDKENSTSSSEDDDDDYDDLGLDFLARKRYFSGNRQSRIMRL